MITGRQIREARLLLGWNVEDLRSRVALANDVLSRAEAVDETPSITLYQAGLIQQAFERAGIRFGSDRGVVTVARQ